MKLRATLCTLLFLAVFPAFPQRLDPAKVPARLDQIGYKHYFIRNGHIGRTGGMPRTGGGQQRVVQAKDEILPERDVERVDLLGDKAADRGGADERVAVSQGAPHRDLGLGCVGAGQQ